MVRDAQDQQRSAGVINNRSGSLQLRRPGPAAARAFFTSRQS